MIGNLKNVRITKLNYLYWILSKIDYSRRRSVTKLTTHSFIRFYSVISSTFGKGPVGHLALSIEPGTVVSAMNYSSIFEGSLFKKLV